VRKRLLVSMRQYAEMRGVSAMAVSKAAAVGRITLVDGKVDVELADCQWRENTHPAARGCERLAATSEMALQAGTPRVN